MLRTRDARWRVEVRDDGLVDLFHLGALVLRRASLERVGRRLAEEGVSSKDLVED